MSSTLECFRLEIRNEYKQNPNIMSRKYMKSIDLRKTKICLRPVKLDLHFELLSNSDNLMILVCLLHIGSRWLFSLKVRMVCSSEKPIEEIFLVTPHSATDMEHQRVLMDDLGISKVSTTLLLLIRFIMRLYRPVYNTSQSGP